MIFNARSLAFSYTADRLLLQFHFQECYLKRSAVGVITENPMGVQYKLRHVWIQDKKILVIKSNKIINDV